MIQQLIDGLYDSIGIDRTPVKHSRPKKPKHSEYIQLSIFEVLKEWAEKQLDFLYSLYSECIKDLKQLQNPESKLSKFLKTKRNSKIIYLESRVRVLINEISEFSFCWGLI